MSLRRAESLFSHLPLGLPRLRRRSDQRSQARRPEVAAFEEWQRNRPSAPDPTLFRLIARRSRAR
jgi:hypothetical protein